MPEYSSTTITPVDGVKTPAMNGSTSGNYTLSALRDFILASKGQANGLASLDGNGKLLSSQLPDLADDVIVVASYASLPATGTAGKIYITADNNKMYRWNPDLATPDYVELSIDLSEYAKIVDIQDGNIQAGVAVKAFQDAMGRAIITTYATKADLQDGTLEPLISTKSRQDQNGNVIDQTYETKADASDLKDAIESNSQRIENLEVAVSGSLVQTNTDSTMANTKTITNANEILPWAILKRVGARAVAWNQLVQNGNFANGDGWVLESGVTASFNDNIATISSTIENNGIRRSVDFINGHKYLVSAEINTESALNVKFGTTSSNGVQVQITTSVFNQFVRYSEIKTALADSYTFFIFVSGTYSNLKVRNVMLFDLTAMNEASLTADQFRAKFPASYYPYNTGEIIPLNPSAFKVVGRNKINHNGWEANHAVSTTSGNVFFINGYSCTDFIKVNPSTTYYNKANAGDGGKCYYDANKNFLWGGQAGVNFNWNASFTLADNVHYIRFYKASTSITDFCLNISDANDGTFTEYKETTIDTSQISDGHYVNDSVYDYVENVMENGVTKGKKHKGTGEVSNISLFSHQGNNLSSGGLYYADYDSSLIKTYGSAICNLLPFKATGAWESTTPCLQVGNGRLRIYTTASTQSALLSLYSDIHIYYGLKEEIVTDVEPIRNFPVEDGTTITAVTPQTDLVNAVDVPNTIAYMTKISS